MRRLLSMLAIVCLAGLPIGCHHLHGVCDCDPCEDLCARRAPWMSRSAAAPRAMPANISAPGAETPAANNSGN